MLGRPLIEAAFEPIFAELERRRGVLYLHPAGNSACSPLIAEHHLTWMVSAPVEDTISIMHLITHGIPRRYPNSKIINSHLGGALPMLLQRADNQYPWEAPNTPELPSETKALALPRASIRIPSRYTRGAPTGCAAASRETGSDPSVRHSLQVHQSGGWPSPAPPIAGNEGDIRLAAARACACWQPDAWRAASAPGCRSRGGAATRVATRDARGLDDGRQSGGLSR